MSYIVKQDLLDELGQAKLIQLTDDAGTGEVNDARVDKAIAYAVGTFEAYARSRYELPVPVTEKVRATCLDLAVYHLYKSRATTDEGVWKIKRQAFDDALSFLKAIQKGEAALDVPTAAETEENPGSPDEVLKGSSRAVFTDDKLSSF